MHPESRGTPDKQSRLVFEFGLGANGAGQQIGLAAPVRQFVGSSLESTCSNALGFISRLA